ncbi:MAG: GntR family transcriptional regulator [Pseudomonadota bacterium]
MENPSGISGKSTLLRPALAVEVANSLRDLILEGELAGGEKIREKELTERFGVSRTPLREAMKMLSSEGLIELIPNRGAVISQSSTEDLMDAFPVLAALEGLAGAQAAERATDEELAEISRLTRELQAAFDETDRPQYFDINQSIHNAILAASRNAILERTHATLASQVHRARYQANLESARWKRAVIEHTQISEALTERRADDAKRLLHDHMMSKLSSIVRLRGASEDDSPT